MTRVALVLIVALSSSLMAQAPAPVDALFETFFAAESPADALVLADQIAASGVDFDVAYARLKKQIYLHPSGWAAAQHRVVADRAGTLREVRA